MNKIHLPTLVNELEDINAHNLALAIQFIIQPFRLYDKDFKPPEYTTLETLETAIDIFTEKLTEQKEVLQKLCSGGLEKDNDLLFEINGNGRHFFRINGYTESRQLKV